MTIDVVRDRSRKMKHTVHVRQHSFAVDEPEANGGEDLGPTPHDVYDSALGACKALTVLWYARRKQIPVDDIRVTVERDDSQERGRIYRLPTTLHITGPLSDAQPQGCPNGARNGGPLVGARDQVGVGGSGLGRHFDHPPYRATFDGGTQRRFIEGSALSSHWPNVSDTAHACLRRY